MKEELPIEMPELLRLKIRAGLLQIEHSGQKDTRTRLDAAYSVFARTLSQGGETLSSLLLKEKIPGWAFKWAIERKWVTYPPQRVRREWPNFSGKCISSHESVPKEELTVKFGDYTVTEEYRSQIMAMFEVAIAHWEAEVADGAGDGGALPAWREPATEAIQAPSPQSQDVHNPHLSSSSSREARSAERRRLVDCFLEACNRVSKVRIGRAHIWRSVGHRKARQFEYWQAGDDRLPHSTRGATRQDDQNFRRVLTTKPEVFVFQLKSQKIDSANA